MLRMVWFQSILPIFSFGAEMGAIWEGSGTYQAALSNAVSLQWMP